MLERYHCSARALNTVSGGSHKTHVPRLAYDLDFCNIGSTDVVGVIGKLCTVAFEWRVSTAVRWIGQLSNGASGMRRDFPNLNVSRQFTSKYYNATKIVMTDSFHIYTEHET